MPCAAVGSRNEQERCALHADSGVDKLIYTMVGLRRQRNALHRSWAQAQA